MKAAEGGREEVELGRLAQSKASSDAVKQFGQRMVDDHGNANKELVKVPTGPLTDILHAWHGDLAYDPALVKAPVAIVRGAWDGVLPDSAAGWLFDAFANSPAARDIKISRATHLMHLEAMRYALYLESIAFLLADDDVPPPDASRHQSPSHHRG